MNLSSLNYALEVGFNWTWKTSWEATIVIALVLSVQLLFKKILTPRWQYALGLLVLLRLGLPVAPSSSFSLFNLGRLFSARPTTQTAVPVANVPPPLPVPPFPLTQNDLGQSKIQLLSMAKYFWLAGCVGMFALVGWRYQKLNCEVNKLKPVDDPRVLGLLDNCRALLGIKKHVRLLTT
ncbi:MAG TPA: M56 family metallopeptidase, partial [Verrucomicrobiae bacterium]|nr:M56 family metallopeptidase [Verrucomicrobiae bacterium]